MNEIKTLFTDIGSYFTGSDWFSMVKWPFWLLLCTVAFGGVYCARFGKKTLLNQGIAGTLHLLAIYLGVTLAYIAFPPLRGFPPELPFLGVTNESIALVDPFTLDLAKLSSLLLRLMILTLLINGFDTFSSGGKSIISWLFSQIVMLVFGLFAYAIIIGGITIILPAALDRYAIIPVFLALAAGFLMICAKFIFTVVLSEGNPYFSSVYKFFTVSKGGSLFTVSALSFLMLLVVLAVMRTVGLTMLTYASVNATGLGIILALILAALYIFCMYYIDRKKS